MPPKAIKNKNRKDPPLREDRELERRRSAAIDDMLKECEALPAHEKLMAIMKWMGSPVLRSNVSRDSKDEGAVRSEGGDPIDSLVERSEESPFRKVQGLILNAMPLGDYVIFMNTREGAGLAVAAAIDASHWEELAGIVPGGNSVVLLTEDQPRQARVMYRLKYFANRYGGERGEVERRPLYG